MAYNPQNTSGGMMNDLELIEEGIHDARLIRVIELGIHSDMYGPKKRVAMGFLLPNVTMDLNGETKQRMMWTYNLNQAENKDCTFNKYCRAVKTTATSIDELIGLPCTLQIEHDTKRDGRVVAEITSVVKPRVGLEIPEADTEMYYFDWDNPSKEVWELLSDKRKDFIQNAENFSGSAVERMLKGGQSTTEDSPI